jgi:hypothetical protein
MIEPSKLATALKMEPPVLDDEDMQSFATTTERFGDQTFDALDLLGEWIDGNAAFLHDASLRPSQRTGNEFGFNDLCSYLGRRDVLERVLDRLPDITRSRLQPLVDTADAKYKSWTESGAPLLTTFADCGWWWRRRPNAGPVAEELDRP